MISFCLEDGCWKIVTVKERCLCFLVFALHSHMAHACLWMLSSSSSRSYCSQIFDPCYSRNINFCRSCSLEQLLANKCPKTQSLRCETGNIPRLMHKQVRPWLTSVWGSASCNDEGKFLSVSQLWFLYIYIHIRVFKVIYIPWRVWKNILYVYMYIHVWNVRIFPNLSGWNSSLNCHDLTPAGN